MMFKAFGIIGKMQTITRVDKHKRSTLISENQEMVIFIIMIKAMTKNSRYWWMPTMYRPNI